jgi:hypothetical protein
LRKSDIAPPELLHCSIKSANPIKNLT